MKLSRIARILGGMKVLHTRIKTRMDLVELSKKGVSKDALVNLAGYLSLSVGQIAQFLPVTERTIQRYSSEKRFNPVVSEHILQLAELAARGVQVFGRKERFLSWLNHPNAALGDRTPSSLLCSRFGTEMVLDELGRIEHGVII